MEKVGATHASPLPRIHSPQIAQINGSIGEFGWTTPILINAEGGVIGGHGRLEAAVQRGMDQVPVIRLAHLTPEQAQAYRIADNRLTELGEWDQGLLSAELEALQAVDFDLELTGFDWKALEDLMPPEDAQAALDDQSQLDERQGRDVQCPECAHGFRA